jgi:hypothetical protein
MDAGFEDGIIHLPGSIAPFIVLSDMPNGPERSVGATVTLGIEQLLGSARRR